MPLVVIGLQQLAERNQNINGFPRRVSSVRWCETSCEWRVEAWTAPIFAPPDAECGQCRGRVVPRKYLLGTIAPLTRGANLLRVNSQDSPRAILLVEENGAASHGARSVGGHLEPECRGPSRCSEMDGERQRCGRGLRAADDRRVAAESAGVAISLFCLSGSRVHYWVIVRSMDRSGNVLGYLLEQTVNQSSERRVGYAELRGSPFSCRRTPRSLNPPRCSCGACWASARYCSPSV